MCADRRCCLRRPRGLLVLGLYLLFLRPLSDSAFTFESFATITAGDLRAALVIVTPTRTIGAELVWASTAAAFAALGRRSKGRADAPANRSTVALALAATLLVVGLLLVFACPEDGNWFMYGGIAPAGEEVPDPTILVLTIATAVGSLLVWTATLIAAFVAGRRAPWAATPEA